MPVLSIINKQWMKKHRVFAWQQHYNIEFIVYDIYARLCTILLVVFIIEKQQAKQRKWVCVLVKIEAFIYGCNLSLYSTQGINKWNLCASSLICCSQKLRLLWMSFYILSHYIIENSFSINIICCCCSYNI